MKTTIFLLGLCLSAISAMGQQNHRKSQIGQNHFQMNRNLATSEFQNRIEKVQKRDINKRFNNQSTQLLKSSDIIKQGLDSVVYEVFDQESGTFIGDGKNEYTYDSNGNLASEIYLNYDGTMKKVEYTYVSNGYVTLEIEYRLDEPTGNWIRVNKYENTYDSNGICKLVIEYEWDEITSKWQIRSKVEYEFASNGNLTLEVRSSWDETISKWIVYIKIENEYDSNGNLTVHSDFNSTGDKVSRKTEYTYDSNGNLTLEIFYYWNEVTSKWILTGKNEYTYDSNGNLTLEINYGWDEITSKLVERYKTEYTNDSKGNPTLKFYYSWDEITSKWTLIFKSEETYDSNGNSTSSISYEWDETTSTWVGSSKWEDGYDSYGNLTFISEYEWDETISNWIGWKDESIYDYNYLAKDLILPYWLQDENIKHKKTDVLYYSTNENTGQLYVEGRGKLFYSDKTITGIDVIKQQKLRIYPNPASDYLNLDFNNNSGSVVMEFYDYQGKMVLKMEVYPDIKMSVKHLQQGLYLYKLNYQYTTETGKILILR